MNEIAPLTHDNLGPDLNYWCVSTWFYRRHVVDERKALWRAVRVTLVMLALIGLSFWK